MLSFLKLRLAFVSYKHLATLVKVSGSQTFLHRAMCELIVCGIHAPVIQIERNKHEKLQKMKFCFSVRMKWVKNRLLIQLFSPQREAA